jgi:hypothetical protein
MSLTRVFALAGGVCVALVVIGSAVMRSACEGDLEGCGTAGESAYAVSVVSAALAIFFLAAAGLALAVRTLRRSR